MGDTFYVTVKLINPTNGPISAPPLSFIADSATPSYAGARATATPLTAELQPGVNSITYAVDATWKPTSLSSSGIQLLNDSSSAVQNGSVANDLANLVTSLQGFDSGAATPLEVGTDIINLSALLDVQITPFVTYHAMLSPWMSPAHLQSVPDDNNIVVSVQPQVVDAWGAYIENAYVNFATGLAGTAIGVEVPAAPIVAFAVGSVAYDATSQLLTTLAEDIAYSHCGLTACMMMKYANPNWDAEVMSGQLP